MIRPNWNGILNLTTTSWNVEKVHTTKHIPGYYKIHELDDGNHSFNHYLMKWVAEIILS